MKKFIYKICKISEWSDAKKKRKFTGTKKDIEDGFIHFSKKKQVQSTLKKYFSNKDNLILLKVETSKLKKLIWEKSASGSVFPHLYSYLNINKIKSVYKISIKKKVYSFKKILK
jgi:uncharacterized protein (DUF952 family)